MTFYMQTYREKNREALAEKSKRRRDELQWRLVQLLGGVCQFPGCGRMATRETMCAFDFHHRDPSTKKFGLSASLTRTWMVLEEEALKCDLLCAFCHRLVDHKALRAAPGRPKQRSKYDRTEEQDRYWTPKRIANHKARYANR